jgi:phage head maturation protease
MLGAAGTSQKATGSEQERLRKARDARSRRYGIEVRADGHLTPPKGYPTTERAYGDPVNWLYPLEPEGRLRAARARFKGNAQRYKKPQSRKAVHTRIVEALLRAGITVSYNPDDPLDRQLPAELRARIQKALTCKSQCFTFGITKAWEIPDGEAIDAPQPMVSLPPGSWVERGVAATTDLDFGQYGPPDVPAVQLTPNALKRIVETLKALDLRTTFRNHDLSDEVGNWHFLELDEEKGQIVYEAIITKARPDIWVKVQDGTLRKNSISFFILKDELVTENGRTIQLVHDAVGIEISKVGVPMNPAAAITESFVAQGREATTASGPARRHLVRLALACVAPGSHGAEGLAAHGDLPDLPLEQQEAVARSLCGRAIASPEGGVARVTSARVVKGGAPARGRLIIQATAVKGAFPAQPDREIEVDLLARGDRVAVLGLSLGEAKKESSMTTLERVETIRKTLRRLHEELNKSGNDEEVGQLRDEVEAQYEIVKKSLPDLEDPLDPANRKAWGLDDASLGDPAPETVPPESKQETESATEGDVAPAPEGSPIDEAKVSEALHLLDQALTKKGLKDLAQQVRDELCPTPESLARKAAADAANAVRKELEAERVRTQRQLDELRAEVKHLGGLSQGSRRDWDDDTREARMSANHAAELADLDEATRKRLSQWMS